MFALHSQSKALTLLVGRQSVLADLLQPAYRSLRVRYLHSFGQLLLGHQADWRLLEAALFCFRRALGCNAVASELHALPEQLWHTAAGVQGRLALARCCLCLQTRHPLVRLQTAASTCLTLRELPAHFWPAAAGVPGWSPPAESCPSLHRPRTVCRASRHYIKQCSVWRTASLCDQHSALSAYA